MTFKNQKAGDSLTYPRLPSIIPVPCKIPFWVLPLNFIMPKSQRITIKPHNIAYLQSLASQMGLNDLREVLNYLLLDCKGLGYQFGNKPAPQPITQVPIGYTFEPAFTPQENAQNFTETDPIIARMSQLLEEF